MIGQPPSNHAAKFRTIELELTLEAPAVARRARDEAAATRIQSGLRGRAARRTVAAKHRRREAKAATRIQAAHRGRQGRLSAKQQLRVACADGVKPLMKIFEERGDEYGWMTATDTIKRVTKALIKDTARFGAARFAADSAAVTQDPQFERLLAIPALALEQNVMDSKARMGHSTDDLSSLKDSLVQLKLTDTRLYELLDAKLKEELEEEDEPGEFGHDFQGGSVGF